MGQAASSFDPRYTRAWANLDAMTSDTTRLQAVDMLLGSPEYIAAAKRAGIYADLLAWSAAKRRAQHYAWPRPYTAAPPPPAAPRPTYSPPPAQAAPRQTYAPPTTHVGAPRPMSMGDLPAPAITRAPPRHAPPPSIMATAGAKTVGGTELAKIPPPKRALDHLTECYHLLNLDDSKPLSHEVLRAAYKRAAIKSHPDKGGNPEAFDAVNRAFLYIEEVLNKLLPKSSGDKADPRFTMTVNPESAIRARGDYVAGSVPAGGAAPPRSESVV